MSDVWVWSSLFDLESTIKQVFLSISCYLKYRFERSMNEVQTNIRSSSFRDSFFVIISHDWACKVLQEDLSTCFQQSAVRLQMFLKYHQTRSGCCIVRFDFFSSSVQTHLLK